MTICDISGICSSLLDSGESSGFQWNMWGSVKYWIPKEFHEFLDVFSEEKAAQFPESQPWDHKIEMKDTFVPKSFKTYNLTPQEQIELDKFLKENLEKGYIRPSQSPMASPFFFVDKKDGKLSLSRLSIP